MKSVKKSNQCTAKGHAGAPTKYDPKYCEEIMKFFDIQPHFETPVTTTYKDGTTKEEIKLLPSDLPTLAGFAVKLGVHRDTINQWSKDYPEFSDAIKRAKECQENILITNGLQGLYAQPFAIITTKNVLGWRDKSDTDITSKGEKIESNQIVFTNFKKEET